MPHFKLNIFSFFRVHIHSIGSTVAYYVVFCFLVFCLPSFSVFGQTATIHGTTVVAIVDSHGIAIAADSKQVTLEHVPGPNICKIKVVGNTVIAIAGVRNSFVDNKRFDVLEIAEQACMEERNLKQKADRFEKRITPLLEKSLPVLKGLRGPGVKDGVPVVDLVFCAIESNIPTVIVKSLDEQIANGKSLIGHDTKIYKGDSVFQFVACGETTAINNNRDRLASIKIANVPRFAAELVALEINSRPDIVGFPISVITITVDKGIVWQQQGECESSSSKQRSEPAKPTRRAKRISKRK